MPGEITIGFHGIFQEIPCKNPRGTPGKIPLRFPRGIPGKNRGKGNPSDIHEGGSEKICPAITREIIQSFLG